MNEIPTWRVYVEGHEWQCEPDNEAAKVQAVDEVRYPSGEMIRMEDAQELARAVLSLAEDGGMPDSFKETDSRIQLARSILPSDTQP